jgi:hypothetical protein
MLLRREPFRGDLRPGQDDPFELAQLVPAGVGRLAAGDDDRLHVVAARGELLAVPQHLPDGGAQLPFFVLAADRLDLGDPDGLPACPGQVVPQFSAPG